MSVNNKMFFDLRKYIKLDYLYNFFLGGRGCGKTFSFKKTCVEDFKATGEQFVYVRRTVEEIKPKKMQGFFDILKTEYPEEFGNDEFKVKDGFFFINGEVAGYAMALSRAEKDKGINDFPRVTKIIVDEFIMKEDRYHQYLDDEVELLENLIETIARLRDVPVFFFSNRVTDVNPYFLYYKIRFTPNAPHKFRRGEFYAENLEMSDYKRAKKETRRAKALEGTRYYNYAIENEALIDDSTNIKTKTGDCRIIAAVIIDGVKLGIWKGREYKVYYISENAKNTKIIYTFDFSSVGNQKLLLNYRSPIIKNIQESFENGLLFYESQKCKSIFMKILKR